MGHVVLDVDDPAARFGELVDALNGDWLPDEVGRAEWMRADGVTLRVGMSSTPEGPFLLGWSAEAEVPDRVSYGAMGVALLGATVAFALVSLVLGRGLVAALVAAAVLALLLRGARVLIARGLVDTTDADDVLGREVCAVIEHLDGVTIRS